MDNRVKEFGKLTGEVAWEYCPTKENPADLGTRGQTLKEIDVHELWWNGPSWLCSKLWPSEPQIEAAGESQEEELKQVLLVQSDNVVRQKKRGCKKLEVEEINCAEEMWIKEVQRELQQGL
eukprot:gene18446-20294_t